MADNKIKISSYFKTDRNQARTNYEFKRVLHIRNMIDSFSDEADAANWIYNRRLKAYNRKEDFKLFGIPENAEIDLNYPSKINVYYNPKLEEERKQKELEDGELRNQGLAGKAIAKGKNIANSLANTKVGKFIVFIIRYPATFFIITGIISLIISIFMLIMYVSGVIDSIGQTPFVLCDETSVVTVSELTEEEIDEMATPEYAVNALIYYCKERRWTKNATIGIISYALQEGTGMGTFTYESYWVSDNGPTGTSCSTLLNNLIWLDFINNQGKQIAHEIYEENNRSNWAAIGLGLFQSSDVWPNDGDHKSTTNATELIEYAIEQETPWQDPYTQLCFYFDVKYNDLRAWDSEYCTYGDSCSCINESNNRCLHLDTCECVVYPDRDDLTPEEWCRRFCAGIGMPGWKWTDEGDDYMLNHCAHLTTAENYYNNYSRFTLVTLNEYNFDPCSRYNSKITGGNASIADAAVSLSPFGNGHLSLEGADNSENPKINTPSMQTYKTVKDSIFPRERKYASASVAVATAVRWAGADDNFPSSDVDSIHEHLEETEEWQYIGIYGDCDLSPGDILICNDSEHPHVKIYVGAAAKIRFPDSNSNMFESDSGVNYPHLYLSTPEHDNYNRTFYVYRNITPDNSDTYSNIEVN